VASPLVFLEHEIDKSMHEINLEHVSIQLIFSLCMKMNPSITLCFQMNELYYRSLPVKGLPR
jgi:hypothetical protein